MRWKRLLLIFVLVALPLIVCPIPETLAQSAPARELSMECTFTSDGRHAPFSRLTDGKYQSPFDAQNGWLTIAAPDGETIGSLYLCFCETPERWSLECETINGWEAFLHGGTEYAHAVFPVPDLTQVRIVVEAGALSLHEVRVFAAGALPDDIQQWKPSPAKADIMLLVAHPDDEFLFFGGLIPWYAAQGKHVLVTYMTCQDATRRAELLNGLWTAGLREYPVIGSFADRSTRTLDDTYAAWTRESADCFVVKLLRKHRPEVLVTHGDGGEYGHGAHKACADISLRMFDKSGDPLYLPQHREPYGVWQVKKLYLHLFAQNQLRMNWTRAVSNGTAISIAEDAFRMHMSQQHFSMSYDRSSRYDNALFGLAKTTVGLDDEKQDFFEHVE